MFKIWKIHSFQNILCSHLEEKILTGVVWYCSSPHTWWALWCYNARGTCSRTFGNGNHSKETSGKYRRRLVSDTFSEPVNDRKKYFFSSDTLQWLVCEDVAKCFRYSRNYVSSREHDLKPPPAALLQSGRRSRCSNPSVIFYCYKDGQKALREGMSMQAAGKNVICTICDPSNSRN